MLKRSLSKSSSSDIKKQRIKSLSERNVFSDFVSSTFKNISSRAETNEDIIKSIKDFDIIDKEDEYSKIIYDKFLDIPLEDRIKLHEFNSELELKFFTSKSLIVPETIINILSNEINMDDIRDKTLCDNKTICKSYGSGNMIQYLLTFIDIIGLNVLYIINDNDKDYISPLNNKKYRNFIRTQGYRNYNNYVNKYNKYTENILFYMKQKNLYSSTIDCNNYDLILKHNSLGIDKLYEISLINLQYNSSLISNILIVDRDNHHKISINKCNNNFIINTTWKPFNKYKIDNINIDEKNNYKIIDKKCFKKVIKTRYLDDYYKLYNYTINDIDMIYDNINIFSSKINNKIYKNLEGGGPCDNDELKEFDICKNIYFPRNKKDHCWFSSLINVLFNSDNIAEIVLNKTLRQMNKILKSIDSIDYSIVQFDVDKVISRLNKNFILIVSFIYSSFYLLAKNKINKITNIKKWKEIFDKITDDEMYNKIYTYILVLEYKSLENVPT